LYYARKKDTGLEAFTFQATGVVEAPPVTAVRPATAWSPVTGQPVDAAKAQWWQPTGAARPYFGGPKSKPEPKPRPASQPQLTVVQEPVRHLSKQTEGMLQRAQERYEEAEQRAEELRLLAVEEYKARQETFDQIAKLREKRAELIRQREMEEVKRGMVRGGPEPEPGPERPQRPGLQRLRSAKEIAFQERLQRQITGTPRPPRPLRRQLPEPPPSPPWMYKTQDWKDPWQYRGEDPLFQEAGELDRDASVLDVLSGKYIESGDFEEGARIQIEGLGLRTKSMEKRYEAFVGWRDKNLRILQEYAGEVPAQSVRETAKTWSDMNEEVERILR